jgi:hypothetical protein
LAAGVGTLLAVIDAVLAQADQLRAARAALAARAEASALRGLLYRSVAERRRLADEVDRGVAELDRAAAERDRLGAERDRLDRQLRCARDDAAAADQAVDDLMRIRPVPGCPHVSPEDGLCAHPAAITPECHPGADCPMLATLVGPPYHVIDLRGDGWTLAHPLRCHADPSGCGYAAASLLVFRPPLNFGFGRYRVSLTQSGELLVQAPEPGSGDG